jgi:hypothetical protein
MIKCKSCGAPIKWVKMKSGRMVPVEVTKTSIVYLSAGFGFVEVGNVPHWGNCPNPDNHRFPKATNQEIGPLTKREPGA